MRRIYSLFFLSIVLIIVSLLFFHSKGAFISADSSLSRIISPVTTVFSGYGSGIGGFFSSLGKIGSLQKENADLRGKINDLESKLAIADSQIKENESLKKELEFKTKTSFETIAAEVAYFDPSNIRDTITINKGAQDGVETKMAVVSQGVFVGRVSDVYPKTARVILINDPLSSTPAVIEGTNLLGLVQGQLGLGMIMTQIPIEEEVKNGQMVATSGLGGELPKGLVIGRVENVEKKNNSIFQTALLRSLVNLQTLERVQLIKK